MALPAVRDGHRGSRSGLRGTATYSSRTVWGRRGSATASWCWTAGGWSNRGRTRNCGRAECPPRACGRCKASGTY